MAKVMYDKNGVLGVVSKSSFLPKEQNRRISRGYCRVNGPNSIYWAGDLVRGRLVAQGQVNVVMKVGVNK